MKVQIDTLPPTHRFRAELVGQLEKTQKILATFKEATVLNGMIPYPECYSPTSFGIGSPNARLRTGAFSPRFHPQKIINPIIMEDDLDHHSRSPER